MRQISFVDMPYTSFNLHIWRGDISALPFLETFLRNTLQALLLPYKLPHGYIVPLASGDIPEEKPVSPNGILCIVLHEARNLPKADVVGYCDPYVEFRATGFGMSEVKTSTIKHKTAHAKWNDEKFTFLVTDRESQIVTITVFDHDRFSKNDPLASTVIAISEVEEDISPEPEWILLPAAPRNLKRGGMKREHRITKLKSMADPVELLLTISYSTFDKPEDEEDAAQLPSTRSLMQNSSPIPTQSSVLSPRTSGAFGILSKPSASPSVSGGVLKPSDSLLEAASPFAPDSGQADSQSTSPNSSPLPVLAEKRVSYDAASVSNSGESKPGIEGRRSWGSFHGALVIHVKSLSNLRYRGWTIDLSKKLQVVIKVGQEELCTEPIPHGLKLRSSIAIDQTLKVLLVDNGRSKALEVIEVYVNRGNANLGFVKIPLSDVVASRRLCNDFQLAGVQQGSICLEFLWHSTGTTALLSKQSGTKSARFGLSTTP
eukprot:jgi/Botrbrau1/7314/Bobra.247_3s0009.1